MATEMDGTNNVAPEIRFKEMEIADKRQLKKNLSECLDKVKFEGTFTSYQRYSTFANPGLHIKKFGAVGLPLPHRDAEAIAQVCKQSPFGKGSETVIDTSVRNTWELDDTEFECRNPAWAASVEHMAKQAFNDLGVQIPARAELYKLLLYEEGAFFKAHSDSEKAPGMFGTLVVCLPSEHSGGDVRLVHGGKEQILQTDTGSHFDLSALAWYSDVQHEVQPVTQGYRLVLTYNLVQDQSLPRQTAASLDAMHSRFEHLLRTWKTNFGHLAKVAYPLEHRYSKASLSLRNLKGPDAAKAHYLDHLCAQNGFYWFLGMMTKTEQQECEGGDSIIEYSLDHIVTPTGVKIGDTMSIEEEEILASDLYNEDRAADSEEEEEFTGNAAICPSYRYHNTVVILMPKENLLHSCPVGSSYSLKNLHGLFQLIQKNRLDSIYTEEAVLKALLGRVVKSLGGARSLYGPIAYDKTAAENHFRFFDSVCNFCYSIGKPELVRNTLQEATRDPAWASSPSSLHIVAKLAEREVRDGMDVDWDMWFPQPQRRATVLDVRRKARALHELEKHLLPSSEPSFKEWVPQHVERMLLSINSYGIKDMPDLVEVLPEVTFASYCSVILPRLMKDIQNKGAVLSLLGLLSEKTSRNPYWGLMAKATCQEVLRTNSELFKLTMEDICDINSLRQRDFIIMLGFALAQGLDTEAGHLLTFALPELPGPDDERWKSWTWMFYFLRVLIPVLEKRRNPSTQEPAATFIKSMLRNNAASLARRRPDQHNWARTVPPYACACDTCQPLRRFLLSPTESTARFPGREFARNHLEKILWSRREHDCQLETDKTAIPYTLVVRKTDDALKVANGEWEEELKYMTKRVYELELLFRDYLEVLLGDDYEVLRSVPRSVDVHLQQTKQSLQASSPAESSIPNGAQVNPRSAQDVLPIIGVKRKAPGEIVDLTGDASD